MISIKVKNKQLGIALQSVLVSQGLVFMLFKNEKLFIVSSYDKIKICYQVTVLSSSDTEMTSICLDANKLYKYINSIDNEDVTLVFDGNSISIKESSFSFQMNILENNATEDDIEIELPDSKFQDISLGVRSMNSILNCISGIISKVSLCDMLYLKFTDEYIEAQATDVFRFFRIRVPNICDKSDIFKISSLMATSLAKILKIKHFDKDILYVARYNNKIYFFTDNLFVFSFETEANIPTFEDISARYKYTHKAVVEKSKMIDSFKRIELVSKENDYKYFCSLTLQSPTEMIARSNSSSSSIEETIPVVNEYETTYKIALNSRMLIDTIEKMLSDKVSIFFADELSPVLLETENISAFVTPLSENIE